MKIKLLDKKDILENYKDIEILFRNFNLLNMEEVIKKLIDFLEIEMCTCLGAYQNDKLIGFLWAFKREFAGERRYHINYFSVKKEKHNQGIGKLLLSELKKIAEKEKIKKIDLNVDIDNKKAKWFYKKNRFKEEKTLLCLELGEE